jgi:hypothetical protein
VKSKGEGDLIWGHPDSSPTAKEQARWWILLEGGMFNETLTAWERQLGLVKRQFRRCTIKERW